MEQVTLSTPHWEALTPETREAFHLAGRLPFIQRYYLAGGTGLALHLGHRFSVDLDLFSPAENAVGPDERAILREALGDPSLVITYDKDMTFVANWRGVGVSFFLPVALSAGAASVTSGQYPHSQYPRNRCNETGGDH